MVSNLVVFILLGGSSYAVYVAADNSISAGVTTGFQLTDLGFDNILTFLRSFQVPEKTDVAILYAVSLFLHTSLATNSDCAS